MDYTALIAAIPALAQAGAGIAQTVKGNRMGRDLKDPIYTIPKSAVEALSMARNQASNFMPPGYEAYMNDIAGIQAGTTRNIERNATSANQALGASLGAQEQQLKALNDYQGFAQGNYQQRQQNLVDALGSMAQYENQKWQNDVLDPFLRKSQAAQALVGSGLQNTMAGTSDLAGIYANRRAAQEERAYQEKRDEEKWKRYMELYNKPMVSSVGTTTPSYTTPEAQAMTEEYLNSLFDNYGDAYSSREEFDLPNIFGGTKNPQELY